MDFLIYLCPETAEVCVSFVPLELSMHTYFTSVDAACFEKRRKIWRGKKKGISLRNQWNMSMKRPEIIRQIKEAIRRKDAEATAILYGSEARGEARADSDIDILILVDGDKLSIAREQEYTAPLYEIEWATGVQISPMVMLRSQWENRPFKTPFYLNIMKEGITL